MNAFVEPQWTVAHDDGASLPKLMVFSGLNLTIAGFGKK